MAERNILGAIQTLRCVKNLMAKKRVDIKTTFDILGISNDGSIFMLEPITVLPEYFQDGIRGDVITCVCPSCFEYFATPSPPQQSFVLEYSWNGIFSWLVGT